MSETNPRRPFLLGQQIRMLTGVKPEDQRFHIFGEDAKKAPSERDRQNDDKHEFWKPIASRDELVRDASQAVPPMKRVGLVCDAGLGKTTNMEWLEARIAEESGGRQIPYLLKLSDSHEDHLDLQRLEDERDKPGTLLDSLASRMEHMKCGNKQQLLPALQRYQQEGRITLLIDGLDHAMTRPNLAATLRMLLVDSTLWRNCPIWVSGRAYAFEACWTKVFEPSTPHDWHYLRVEPLAIPEIRRYQLSQAGGDWSHLFNAAAWNLLAIPRFLLLICDLIRRKTAEAKSTAEKERIVRGLALDTAADLYAQAYFDPTYHDDHNRRGLLGQGVDTLDGYGFAIGGIRKEFCNDLNYPKRIARAGAVLGAIAFELFAKNPNGERPEPMTQAVDFSAIEEDVAKRLVNAKQGGANDLNRDLNILRRMNNHSLDFLVFREVNSKFLCFYDRTVQAFFAAHWAMKYGTQEERDLVQNWIVYQGKEDDTPKRLTAYVEFWEFAAAMPDVLVNQDQWLSVFGQCYDQEPTKSKLPYDHLQWTREMIYHSHRQMANRSLDRWNHWRAEWLKLEAAVKADKATAVQKKLHAELVGSESYRWCPKDPTQNPHLEGLEDRSVPSTVTISGSQAYGLDAGTVHKGDVVSIRVDHWQIGDVGDANENEPLVIQSSAGLRKVIPQGQAGTFTYAAQANGETFRASILGGDGDEKVDVSVAAPGIDLKASLNGFNIVPTQATDLHLKQIFGGEQVTIPVTIANTGRDEAKGPLTVEVFLSSTPNLSGQLTAQAIGKLTTTIDLLQNQARDIAVPMTIPGNLSDLKVGGQYYFVTRVSSNALKDTNAANNIAASDRTFEFLGTPTYAAAFTNGQYFQFIRETLKDDTSAARAQNSKVNVNDPKSFIASFEGDSLTPYLDSKGIPTIGVGINLTAVAADLAAPLAAAVRGYYASQYHDTSLKTKTDGQVIAMLVAQAKAGLKRQAISTADDLALFNIAYNDHRKIAIAVVGLATFNSLSVREQVAVIDQVYNTGSPYPGMAAALQKHDFALAGFNLFDALRTQQGLTAPGLLHRVEAEFQNLLASHKAAFVFLI
jgi:hypothetical protein